MLLFNSLAPGKIEWNFRYVIFEQILVIDGWVISCEIALIWMSLDFTDDQWTLVQVMAWCRQATSHYLSQCWLSSLLPYGIDRPQCVNSLAPGKYSCNDKFGFFKPTSMTHILSISCEIPLGKCHKTSLMISNKLLPEPMLTQMCVTKSRAKAC